MEKIYESENIILEVELCEDNSFDNLFGKLKFIIDGKDLANKDENNFSYFYVDLECLKLILEKNETIQNDLFYISNEYILQYWKEWEIYMKTITIENIEGETTENADFFDKNYFKTGNVFTSFFFDEIMTFFVLENDEVKFKYWDKSNGSEVHEVHAKKSEFIDATDAFLTFFNSTNNYLKNK